MSKAIPSLIPCIDSVLKVRESIGADVQRVWLVTRTWEGRERGDGAYIDTVEEVRPTPRLKSLAHSTRLVEGGMIKQTDLFIESISKNAFPQESLLDGSGESDLVEKLFKIGEYFYRVISVVERHVTWDVQVRRLSPQPDNT